MTPREKADRARQLLDDELMREAFESIRNGLVDRLETVPFGDVDTQHELALLLQLLKQVREQLQTYLNDYAVEVDRQKHESFIQKMRGRIA